MFLGLRTAVYYVSEMEKAKEWYSTVLEIKPYYDTPYYIGFNVAGYELGLHPGKSGPADADSGVGIYWGVDKAQESLDRLLELGATRHKDVEDVGSGILIGSVVDPFGNIFGIIENPHFSLEKK